MTDPPFTKPDSKNSAHPPYLGLYERKGRTFRIVAHNPKQLTLRDLQGGKDYAVNLSAKLKTILAKACNARNTLSPQGMLLAWESPESGVVFGAWKIVT